MNIEELKIISDLIKGISVDASHAFIFYVIMGFIKEPLVWTIIMIGLVKIVGKFSGPCEVLRVKDATKD